MRTEKEKKNLLTEKGGGVMEEVSGSSSEWVSFSVCRV